VINTYPLRVLITGGREVGGMASFAAALREGFVDLGVPAEIIAPSQILLHWQELRDPLVLKILSTSAIFAAPLTRRAICVAHGFPCIDRGWPNMFGKLLSYRLTTASRGAQLVQVSDYAAMHLRSIFGLRINAVIHNPVCSLFLEDNAEEHVVRQAITYVGRLHQAKNVDLLLHAMRDVLDENHGLNAWFVGDGPMRAGLERAAAGDERIHFFGELPPLEVRDRLRRSRVFISGCPHEALGIAYIEALSQGCAVAMPASGGGLEIAPELIGGRIQLFPISLPRQGIIAALRKALLAPSMPISMEKYSARAIAAAYLSLPSSSSSPAICPGEATR